MGDKMIKVLEAEYLNDNFIDKKFVSSLGINDKISFSKENIYYFGNYEEDKIPMIKNKLIRNKKSMLKAIEAGVRFIVCGNSVEMFNNDFKTNGLNIYTFYNPSLFKRRLNHVIIKKDKYKNEIKTVRGLDKVICAVNFKYKNFLCISREQMIDALIKKVKQNKRFVSFNR